MSGADAQANEARVGLLCNCSSEKDPREALSPSILNRAVLLGEELALAGIDLFLFSPREVDEAGLVAGHRVAERRFEPAHESVPRVNANWTYGTRKLIDAGMGYGRFKKWIADRGIEVFVPYAFSELVSNKLKTFEVIESIRPGLHPTTDDFRGTPRQIAAFLERSGKAFIKPRAGNKGNSIFVLQALDAASCALKYYERGRQRSFPRLTFDAALGVIDVAAGRKRYVIQEGVESLRYEGRVFDVRVVVVCDGSTWHPLMETRVAPDDSDLSNVYQGGSIHGAEDALRAALGAAPADSAIESLGKTAIALSEHLADRFPEALMELGFDFVLDEAGGIHLVEVNAKPGISGFGSETAIYDWKPEDQAEYERSVYPHVRHLAAFLRGKIEASVLSGT